MIRKYVCTGPGCGAEVTLDDRRKTQQVAYPRGKGPMSEGYRPHDCPVARGLWPSEIDKHPLSRTVLSGAEGKVS